MNVKEHKKNRDLKLILVGPSPQSHEIDFEIKKWIDSDADNLISLQNASEHLLIPLHARRNLSFPILYRGVLFSLERKFRCRLLPPKLSDS